MAGSSTVYLLQANNVHKPLHLRQTKDSYYLVAGSGHVQTLLISILLALLTARSETRYMAVVMGTTKSCLDALLALGLSCSLSSNRPNHNQ